METDTLLAQQGVAKGELAALRAYLKELESGSRKEVIEAARAACKAAENRLKNAKDEYARHQSLLKQSAISISSFDAKETTYKVATEDRSNSLQRLLALEIGPREEQIEAAKGRWEAARWQLKKVELDIEHSMVSAPVSGFILTKAAEIGEVILPAATVATLAAIDEVWLRGYIGERDLGRVKLGQRVQLTTDSYPTKIYEGVATHISSRAEFAPKNVQTREERIAQVYRVKVTVSNLHREFRLIFYSWGGFFGVFR